jgi:uncharacterized RDD family membrane protein YckC
MLAPNRSPSPSDRRRQAALDSGASLVLAMLAWPFPLARASLAPIVHVVSILIAWQIVQVAYFALCSSVWGKTGGSALLGMDLVADDGERPSRSQAALWGAVAGLLAIPTIVAPSSSPGPAERVSRVSLMLDEPTAE